MATSIHPRTAPLVKLPTAAAPARCLVRRMAAQSATASAPVSMEVAFAPEALAVPLVKQLPLIAPFALRAIGALPAPISAPEGRRILAPAMGPVTCDERPPPPSALATLDTARPIAPYYAQALPPTPAAAMERATSRRARAFATPSLAHPRVTYNALEQIATTFALVMDLAIMAHWVTQNVAASPATHQRTAVLSAKVVCRTRAAGTVRVTTTLLAPARLTSQPATGVVRAVLRAQRPGLAKSATNSVRKMIKVFNVQATELALTPLFVNATMTRQEGIGTAPDATNASRDILARAASPNALVGAAHRAANTVLAVTMSTGLVCAHVKHLPAKATGRNLRAPHVFLTTTVPHARAFAQIAVATEPAAPERAAMVLASARRAM